MPARPEVRDRPGTHGALVVVSRHEPGDQARPHRSAVTHGYAALALYTGGGARVQLNGEWTLRPGDALLVPPGEPHRMLEVKKPELWKLAFCVPCVASDGASALLEPFERVREGSSPVVRVPAARMDFVASLLRELERAVAAADSSATGLAVQKSLLTLIVAEVDRAARASKAKGKASSPRGVVTEALRFIERNCLGELSVADVATAVGRSASHVTTAIKQATGRSAGQWIVSGRLAEARRLLLHSAESVDTIAGRVGYADATHFIRMFRREHGLTPAAWRAAQSRGG